MLSNCATVEVARATYKPAHLAGMRHDALEGAITAMLPTLHAALLR